MTLRPDVVLAVLAMALASYLCRAGGYAVLRATRPPRFVQLMLNHLPGCIFIAFLAPALARGGPGYWLAGAVALGVQVAFRKLALSIIAGVASLWGLQALGS
jgi:uncharacterized membrane protein